MVAGLLVPVAWMKVLKSYQKDRLTSFISPDADRQGSGYQVNQSLIAVDRGIFGAARDRRRIWRSCGSADRLYFRGVCGGTRVCRIVGASAVILYRADAVDPECTNGARPRRAFLVMGVVAVLSFHILVNVGMVVGFMPVTGIPLRS